MKYLFWGETERPNGPGNVNRGFHTHLSRNFLRPTLSNRYLRLLQGAGMLLRCRVLVVSGVSRQGCILTALAGILRKKTVYLLHGSACREALWHPDPLLQKQEAYLLERSALLLCVSRSFRDWMGNAYPQYAGKTRHLYPGVTVPAGLPYSPVPRTVAAAGGDGEIKGNSVLIRAVEMLPDVRLTVYGPARKTGDFGSVRYTGRLPREEFWQGLSETALFVLNSRFESFSLSALEALCLGCSLLITEKAGAAELLRLEESDVIHDPEDPRELAEKIACLLEHPNNRRLLASLNRKELEWDAVCDRLEGFCQELTGRCEQ